MDEDPHPMDYRATLNRMEPGLAPVSDIQSLVSIAISAKRSADKVEMIYSELTMVSAALRDIKAMISSNGASGAVVTVSSSLNAINSNVNRIAHSLEDRNMKDD